MTATVGKTNGVAGALHRSLERRTVSGCKVWLVGNGTNKEGSLETFSSFYPGLTDPTKEETFDASEEECAKACYYSKR